MAAWNLRTNDGEVGESGRSIVTRKSSGAGQKRRVLASPEPAAD
jgi:hypothetical protein